MEKIGNQKIWSYFNDNQDKAIAATNASIRGGNGHSVKTYFELAKKVAELQYLNREHVLLFRGQRRDHLTKMGNTTLKPSLFRLNDGKLPSTRVLERRFEILRQAEDELVGRYAAADLMGIDRLTRHRVLRWTILQHYEVCGTPLLDVIHSLRIAASFATSGNPHKAHLFVLGGP